MKSLQTLLGRVYLPLTAILTCSFAFPSLPVSAIDILNSASAAGDNLPPEGVKSNETSVTAGQAVLELIKTGDRAAAEPGDTVVYRLALKNTGTATASNISITDTLPVGLRYVPESLQASLTSGTSTAQTTIQPATTSNRTVTFNFPKLEPNQTLNVVYATVVTPDAVRGNGRNQAQETRSNIASHQLRIRPGILSDCGTLIGRVFVDKNFDGEQQPGEPGVPNAVIFMDDGNRITTDANGLFSLANVISGYRTGTLDLTSLPGYTLAPNQKFIERNSQSRLVQLEPGGLVRMNFGVTPAYGEGKQ
ncbi:isopeptide-forming domain-containing fimbrial protein [Coleofasciculus sp. FACHB-1120]|uniref:DUF11 domain-containing protein n=1 Tax=Coleofasciculus sp. FACHB-1120 TaxID=2692783 RepID=UPI0016828479|nr:isopeptide-forming domain-containing fimbrial protein [Coleofasciculus sp. FACHB-1120]MBD2740873.1 DUF11 domain-containing protein [Coleofasciculus sp. FACHB-1120]